MTPSERKQLGAYYTSPRVATFLAKWALRNHDDSALDPSFGEGALLVAAADRIRHLGGVPRHQLIGVEKSKKTHAAVARNLAAAGSLRPSSLLHADFFAVRKETLAPVTALLSNPPFIRFHSFNGETRKRALRRARNAGVALSGQSSSWAPFLVHATTFVQTGGRLAVVLPTELLHARYARPVLEYLSAKAAQLTILSFAERLFPNLEQDAVLLLASGWHQGPAETRMVSLESERDLATFSDVPDCAIRVSVPDIVAGATKSMAHLLTSTAADVLRLCITHEQTTSIGEVGTVRIGYVTGAADYFHLSGSDVADWRLPTECLLKTIRGAKDLRGASFAETDWQVLNAANHDNWLFTPAKVPVGRNAISTYIRHGETLGIHETQKCSRRRQWWHLEQVPVAPVVLPAVSGRFVRFAHNAARLTASNALHGLHLHTEDPIRERALVVSMYSSLTQLSAELHGRPLGGGGLKLEPSDVTSLPISMPRSQSDIATIAGCLPKIDALVRDGRVNDAILAADAAVLKNVLGLSDSQCESLRTARTTLSDRRHAHCRSV